MSPPTSAPIAIEGEFVNSIGETPFEVPVTTAIELESGEPRAAAQRSEEHIGKR